LAWQTRRPRSRASADLHKGLWKRPEGGVGFGVRVRVGVVSLGAVGQCVQRSPRVRDCTQWTPTDTRPLR
jgi:hypothetical protein